jgi:hypothetical protein
MRIDPLSEPHRLFVLATSVSLLCILSYPCEANCCRQPVNNGGHADFVGVAEWIIDSRLLSMA